MTKMLTLFGTDIGKLPYNDLVRERAMQVYLSNLIKRQLEKEHYYKSQRVNDTQRGNDKIDFLGIYLTHLEEFIREIDYWLGRKLEPEGNFRRKRVRRAVVLEANRERHRRMMAEDVRTLRLSRAIERDSMYVSWDRDRFMLIASDRGYQTEEALIGDIAKELNIDRSGVRLLMDKGRFTWGQVLVLGAMFDMTPKEFCDIFLAGYFVDRYGEYRASCVNMDKQALLKNPVRPETAEPEEEVEMDIIEIGPDGKPVDEEIWFD